MADLSRSQGVLSLFLRHLCAALCAALLQGLTQMQLYPSLELQTL